ncbi:hypothetical protein GN956_G12062 [Arapaima gigas]
MAHTGFLFARALPITFWIFSASCNILWENDGATDKQPEDSRGEGGYAFFALRSCHLELHGDGGQFFSPDYLCSSPPLWCNWTVQVDPGKRIRLQLEDFTPADACQLKNDQLHLDESPGSGRHRILERCWERAEYTTESNTLHVVLLIGKDPRPPYRGFHGHYYALPPSRKGKPKDKHKFTGNLSDKDKKMVTNLLVTTIPLTLSLERDFGLPTSNPVTGGPQTSDGVVFGSQSSDTKNVDIRNTVGSVAMWNSEEKQNGVENFSIRVGDLVNHHDGNSVKKSPSNETEELDSRHTASVVLNPYRERPMSEDGSTAVQHSQLGPPQWAWSPGDLRNVEMGSWSLRTLNDEWDDQLSSEFSVHHSTSAPVQPWLESGETGGIEMVKTRVTTHAGYHTKTAEPMKESSQSQRYSRNASHLVHLPGDYLFEVAVEVYANVGKVHNWDHFMKSLRMSVETMVRDELRFGQLKDVSFDRVKKLYVCRLHAGVLFILWLQFTEGSEGEQTYRALSSALKRLLRKAVKLGSNKQFNTTFVASISTEDVNECETQLVLCHMHADCVNQFGSYTCHCRPGFKDASRLLSRGPVCVDVEGSAQTVSPMLLQGLYALCFLLGLFLLVLLCIVAVMYRRHHHGMFLVPCQNHSYVGGGAGNNSSCSGGSHLSPPPPPVPRPGDGWGSGSSSDSFPSGSLPLLKFSRLFPSEGARSREQEEGIKL